MAASIGIALTFEEQPHAAAKGIQLNISATKSLPTTYDAAKYQSYRVYHQVQTWLGAIMRIYVKFVRAKILAYNHISV